MSRKWDQELERNIARKAAEELIAAGYFITVNEGDEDVLICSKDVEAILNVMFTTDEDRFYVTKIPVNVDKRGYQGWVQFIWGNVEDCLADYTTNLEDVLKETNAYIEKWSD